MSPLLSLCCSLPGDTCPLSPAPSPPALPSPALPCAAAHPGGVLEQQQQLLIGCVTAEPSGKVIHSNSVILGLRNQKYGLLLIFLSHNTE